MRKKFYITLKLLIALAMVGPSAIDAQDNELSAEVIEQINQLFDRFEEKNSPGLSFGLMMNGELVLTRNIGMADIGTNKAITSQTSFHIGELSRHFTAYAAMLLEHRGSLDLDASVLTYLPDLRIDPAIKVIDLLRHSSGLHDFHIVKTLAGWYHEASYDQEDALNIIQLQDALSFEPGTDFGYSESNLIILAELIGQVSNQPFTAFMHDQVFRPLGMMSTEYKGDSISLSNVANGYVAQHESYIIDEPHNDTYGVSNLYSSTQDILTWEWHMMQLDAQDDAVVQRMKEVVSLDSGRTFSIPQGHLTMGQQFTHKERGLKSDYLSSNYGPYTAAMFNFPDFNLIGVVLSNNSMAYNGYLIMHSAYLILDDEFTEPAVAEVITDHAPNYSVAQLQQYSGSYYDPEFSIIRTIKVSNDTLQYIRSNGQETPLIPIGEAQFQLSPRGDDVVKIHFVEEGATLRLDYMFGEAEAIPLYRYEPLSLDLKSLQDYAGTYHSKALGISYEVTIDDDGLSIDQLLSGSSNLRPVIADLFFTNHWFMGGLLFERDDQGRVVGFSVRQFGAWGIKFVKLDTMMDDVLRVDH